MSLSTSNFWICSFFFMFLFTFLPNFSSSKPMNCSDTSRLCTSFLAFKPNENQTFAVIQSMFDVLPTDITTDSSGSGYIYVKKNCSCLATTHQYATNTTFTITQNVGYVYDVVVSAYSGLAFPPNTTRKAQAASVVSVQLLCGCSSGLWNYLMSYVAMAGDSVQSLSSRFGVSMDRIEEINGILNPDNITAGDLFHIPLDSVPGEPYATKKINPPPPAPAPVSLTNGNISGKSGGNVLSWETRMQIAVEAAQGLEYLHNGCTPPMVHRDVKPTNILLNERSQAKLADFGLSRSFAVDDESHVMTDVAGTPGYLDPEHYNTNWLSEKSDVFSFGVVLLEIVTNQRVIDKTRERPHINEWVGFMLSKGDIRSIVCWLIIEFLMS